MIIQIYHFFYDKNMLEYLIAYGGFMKKFFKVLLVLLLFVPFYVKAASFEVDSKNIILLNLKDNTIVYEENKDDRIKVASMQKIMTTILAIEIITDYNEKVVVNTSIFAGMDPDAAVAGFYDGEVLTYDDFLYAIMLRSGADAAYGIGVLLAGSEEEYVNQMNEKAKEIGLKNTVFKNTIGLDDPDQYSTVSDIAILLKYALNNKKFKEIVNTDKYVTSDGYLSFEGPIVRARQTGMDYFLGGKTGYTEEAGLCLASYASGKETDLLLVTAGADYHKNNQNFYDQKTIYDYFMKNYSYNTIIKKDTLIKKIKTIYDEEVEIKATKDVIMYLDNSIFQKDLKYEYKGEENLGKDVKKGDKIGKYTISYKDTILYEEEVLSPITVRFRLKKIFIIVLLILIGSIIVHLISRNLRKKRLRKKRRMQR